MEYVSMKKVELACRRQERKNLREKGGSLTFCSMLNQLTLCGYFLCHYPETRAYVNMKDGWRNFIKLL